MKLTKIFEVLLCGIILLCFGCQVNGTSVNDPKDKKQVVTLIEKYYDFAGKKKYEELKPLFSSFFYKNNEAASIRDIPSEIDSLFGPIRQMEVDSIYTKVIKTGESRQGGADIIYKLIFDKQTLKQRFFYRLKGINLKFQA